MTTITLSLPDDIDSETMADELEYVASLVRDDFTSGFLNNGGSWEIDRQS